MEYASTMWDTELMKAQGNQLESVSQNAEKTDLRPTASISALIKAMNWELLDGSREIKSPEGFGYSEALPTTSWQFNEVATNITDFSLFARCSTRYKRR